MGNNLSSLFQSGTAGQWAIIFIGFCTVYIIHMLLSHISRRTAGRKKKAGKNEEEELQDIYTEYEIRNVIYSYYLHVNSFNSLLKDYPVLEGGFRDRAVELRDRKALGFIARSSMEFSERMEKAGGTAKKVHALMTEGRYSKAMEMIAEYAEEVEGMETIYDSIKSYMINDCREKVPGKQKKEEAKNTSVSFFAGCGTVKEVEKRYRALCKAYHPDQGYGDEETFRMISKQYEEVKQEFEGSGA